MQKLSRNKSQKGFTLIEMSIVLVIIGLIIGGILKGQEIIESSRSKNVLAEVERIRAAGNTFFDRYKALPGDFALSSTRISTSALVANGDGDGIVESAAAAPAGAANIAASANGGAGAGANSEAVAFFSQMAAADLIGGVTPSNLAVVNFGEGSALPAAAFPGTGFTLIYGLYNDAAIAGAEATGHWLRITKGPASGAAPAAGLMPKQLQAIDVRIDDGLPGNGTVRTGLVGNGCGTLTVATADYVPTTEAVNCIALINLIQ